MGTMVVIILASKQAYTTSVQAGDEDLGDKQYTVFYLTQLFVLVGGPMLSAAR